MRIAIDINDVTKCTPVKDDQEEFVVVVAGASGKSLYEAWQQKIRDQADQPQFQL
jgi:hypothetical protein